MEKRLPFRAFDGAFGTYYFQLTGDGGPCERANVDNPGLVRRIHRQYLEAGAEAVKTNTFALNAQVFPDERERARLLREGYGLAAEEAARYGAKVFCDIGPVQESETGQAEDAYLEAARAFLQLGGTHFLFETQADFAPLKPAVEEIAETCPNAFVAVSFAVSQDGYSQKGLFYRTLIEQALGCPEVHMAGLNCVCGPVHMAELMLRLPETDKPLMALPNAGYPSQAGGRTFFQDNAAYFGEKLAQLSAARPVVVGGCCGTTPEHIRRTLACMAQAKPARIQGAPAQEGRKKAQPGASVFDGAWTKKRVAVELDPPMDADFAPLLEGARAVQAAGADLLTIADSPLARTRANSILSAAIVKRETGMEVLPHLSCRDKNHIAIKGELLGACYEGIRQVLAVTGDPIMQEVFARRAAVFNFNSYELISFIQSLNGDVFRDSPFAVGGALNVNAPKFENELKRACKKEACGASFFLTQPIYTKRALDNLARARQALHGKIMAGFMPVASYKNALFLNHEVSGVEIPQEIVKRLEGASQQQAWDITAPYAAGLMKQAAPHCDGYYLMTPLRKTALVVRLMQEGLA